MGDSARAAPRDLDSVEELGELVLRFYARVRVDDLLGPVFVDQARVDWDEHHAKLTAFWAQLELGIPGFHGRPTAKHGALSQDIPFRREQFARCEELFHGTVDSHWSGRHATSIKERAVDIARAQSRIVTAAEPYDPA